MRVLLVDNYDSFTYNLFHMLVEATGIEATVIRNDEPGWHLGRLADFDAVIISPGPGHPARDADFGICREILLHGQLPTLGICLGHQGIAQVYGGTVGRAPEPVHGRVSSVHHDGEGLFTGLPSPFQVVRYHSLVAAALPEQLEASAWTEDGLLMGLRHRQRPLWGLQFHPESICSEYGHQLLANFVRLAREHHGAPRAAPRRTPRPVAQAPEPGRRARVLCQEMPTGLDGEQVYDRLFRDGPYAFWLDGNRSDQGRFSILGDAGGPLARIATVRDGRSGVTVRSRAGAELVEGDFFDWLARDLADWQTEVPELPGEFALGWVGYLGYGLKSRCGGEPGAPAAEEDAVLVFTDRAVVLDHQSGTSYLLALALDGDEERAQCWLDAATARLEEPSRPLPDPAPQPAPAGAVRLRHDREQYLALIDRCQQEIAAGETYEICLTNELRAETSLDPWEAYRFLRRTSPAPYGAFLQFGAVSVLSTSPERFLRVSADGIAESSPIKGTRPRGRTAAEDEALRLDLATDPKDRAENLMILDLVRNDLGRCAEPGSVHAPEVFAVRSYPKAHQLVSTVRARLAAGKTAVDCVRAAFPPGSMTGAPKVRTMQLIDGFEAGPRGIYAGALGYFSLTGAVDLSVVIRTAVVTDGLVRYGVGGAIVALSDPEAEFEETAVKAAPLLSLLGAEFPGRVTAGATPVHY